MTQAMSAKPRPAMLSRWLWIVALLVIAVVAVGGITRLTESGLSITEWDPVTGVLPPLSEAAWLAEFEKYKQIPEYRERSEEHTSELQSLMRISYAVFCLKTKNNKTPPPPYIDKYTNNRQTHEHDIK